MTRLSWLNKVRLLVSAFMIVHMVMLAIIAKVYVTGLVLIFAFYIPCVLANLIPVFLKRRVRTNLAVRLMITKTVVSLVFLFFVFCLLTFAIDQWYKGVLNNFASVFFVLITFGIFSILTMELLSK